MSGLLKVSSNPHVRARMKTDNIMLLVLIALLPASFFGVWNFGLRSLAVLAVSVASAVLTEYIYEKLMHKKITIGDFSAAVDRSSSWTEPAFHGAALASGHWNSICNFVCQTAFWRSWPELHEPGAGRKMFPFAFLCRQNDRFHLGRNFRRHSAGLLKAGDPVRVLDLCSRKNSRNHRRDLRCCRSHRSGCAFVV